MPASQTSRWKFWDEAKPVTQIAGFLEASGKLGASGRFAATESNYRIEDQGDFRGESRVRRGSCVSFVVVLGAAITAVSGSAGAQSLTEAAFATAATSERPPTPVGAWQTAVSPEAGVPARDPLWTAISLSAAKMRIAHASISPPARPQDPDAQRGPRLTGAGHGVTGLASYYGQGEVTATGERFDPSAMTAAHRTLPFGTRVRVTRVDTGSSVVVRINDRGPFKPGRVIDLSEGAAENLGITRIGLAQVRLEILGR